MLAGQLATMAFGVTDTIVAGRYAEASLAALSVGSAIYMSVYVGLMGVLQALLPEFRLTGPWLAPTAAGWRVGVRLVSSRYLVLQGRARPPGLEITAQTPATLPLRPLALFLAGALMPGNARLFQHQMLCSSMVLTCGVRLPGVTSKALSRKQ